MITMVLEAARQIAKSAQTIRGYRFNDVMFSKALIMNLDPEGVETQVCLQPCKSNGSTSSQPSDFQLYNFSNDQWAEICRGTVIIEYDDSPDEVDDGKEATLAFDAQIKTCEEGIRRCRRGVGTKEMYENLDKFGMSFGPTFQTLREVSVSDEGEASATINVHDWITKVPIDSYQSHVIHPTALDGVFHLTIVALSNGASEAVPTIVPTQLRDLWISNSLLTQPENEIVKLFSNITFQGYREADFSVIALNVTSLEPQIVVGGYRGTAASGWDNASLDHSDSQHLVFKIDWKPDLDLLESEQLSTYCTAAVDDSMLLSEELIDESELVCLYFMWTTLEDLLPESTTDPNLHLLRYTDWLKHHCDQCDARSILEKSEEGRELLQNSLHREAILTRLHDSGPEGRLFVTVGRELVRILHGEVDALDLLFNQRLVQDYYSSIAFAANYAKVATYVDLLAHKNSDLRILEIGAGTGGATAPILQRLSQNGSQEYCTPRYSQYNYTDISPSFFEAAKERFRSYNDRIIYKVLDVENDPGEQSFSAGEYDLVVSSCVLHATASLDATLKNTRKLLKPGGKLVLFEPCNRNCSRIPFVFGLLPGWWLGTEDDRRWGPLISDQEWHVNLSRNGFSGIDVCLRDYQAESRHTFSVMISTAIQPEAAPSITSESPSSLKLIRASSKKLQRK